MGLKSICGSHFIIRLNHQKFNTSCQVGVVVRVRSVRLKTEINAGYFELEPTSQTNLLLFQPFMKQSIEISERVIDDQMLNELINEAST